MRLEAMRLEAWAAPSFETPAFGGLLRMRAEAGARGRRPFALPLRARCGADAARAGGVRRRVGCADRSAFLGLMLRSIAKRCVSKHGPPHPSRRRLRRTPQDEGGGGRSRIANHARALQPRKQNRPWRVVLPP